MNSPSQFDIDEFSAVFRGALERGDSLEDAYREAYRLTVTYLTDDKEASE